MQSTPHRLVPFLATAHFLVFGVLVAPRTHASDSTIEGLSATEVFRLRAALSIAQRKLKGQNDCRRLFLELDGEGPELLRRARFRPANLSETRKICGSGEVAMFTTVGGEQVGVCRAAVERLTRYQLAVALIHEALHMGGMPESPAQRGAPTSAELNRLVSERCSL